MPGTGREMRVMITGAGTATAISVLKGLRSQTEVPARVVMADAQTNVAGRFLADDFVQIPSASDSGYLTAIMTACAEHRIDLLVPIVDYEFPQLAEEAGKFLEMGTRIVISSPEAIRLCGDKWLLTEFIASLGLSVAKNYAVEQALSGSVEFPLFVKPRRGGRASLGAQMVASTRELEVALAALDDPLVQEFVDGQEWTIDTLCDLDGRFVAAVPRVRTETKAGVSVKGRAINDPELIDVARTVSEALSIVGPCNVQCFRLDDGSIVVSEVNPRFSGAFTLSLAAGLNSPLLLLKMHRGEHIDSNSLDLTFNVSMVRYWQEIFTYDDAYSVVDPWPPWGKNGAGADSDTGLSSARAKGGRRR